MQVLYKGFSSLFKIISGYCGLFVQSPSATSKKKRNIEFLCPELGFMWVWRCNACFNRSLLMNLLQLLFGEVGTLFRILWTTFTANFSGKPAVPPGKNNWPSRILVFFCLLGTFKNYIDILFSFKRRYTPAKQVEIATKKMTLAKK